ncbi:hypothetical protein [Hyphomicrobium sp.]|uniref:hypothetical protein n=1 Tax=Hyphomicrobium sp. TaxID=82 RepID=UPI003F71079E
MDSAALVSDGKAVVDALVSQGMQLQAAAWLYETDSGWRFAVVPRVPFKSRHEIYTRIANAVRATGANIPPTLIEAYEPQSLMGMELNSVGAIVTGQARSFDAIRLGPYFYDRAIVFKTPDLAS